MNFFVLSQVARARTSVPWWDQWAFIQELALRQQGKPLWPIRWSPYCGYRLVIPRLLFLASGRWGALSSLTWLTMLVQFVHIGLLIALAWLLLGRKSVTGFVVACIVILNLMLSPLQMQNFVWSLQTMFPLNYAAATASFLCLALTTRWRLFFPVAITIALAASYTMPNGLLVWPILLAQAWFLRLGRRVSIALAAIGSIVIGTYFWHYQRPDLGMGVIGMIRDPIHSIPLLGLLLGGPIDFLSIPIGIAATILMLLVTGYVAFRSLERTPWLSTIAARRRLPVSNRVRRRRRTPRSETVAPRQSRLPDAPSLFHPDRNVLVERRGADCLRLLDRESPPDPGSFLCLLLQLPDVCHLPTPVRLSRRLDRFLSRMRRTRHRLYPRRARRTTALASLAEPPGA
jgi:hypothetical protein